MGTAVKAHLKTSSLRIGGMSCVNCQIRIEKKLKSTVGVEDAAVSYNTGTATVTYNTSVVTLNEIARAIETLDYTVLEGRRKIPVSQIAGSVVIIVSLFVLLQGLGLNVLGSAFPLAEAGMGYGMLFVIGLVTSVHCIAMCGGINLSQCMPAAASLSGALPSPVSFGASPPVLSADAAPKPRIRLAVLLPGILYNGGRVVSYTLVGVIVGALGSVITLSGRFQGAVQLAAGVFMVIMGINMLGFFPGLRRFSLRMPKLFANKIDKEKSSGKGPLFIGLLNGLMPCGPLQAMQLYALSTGSPIRGGISMFLFSAGTVPLMFGVGALGSVLSGASRGRAFTRRVMRIGAILVTVLGMTMFSNGWNLSGFGSGFADRLFAAFNPFGSSPDKSAGSVFEPVIVNGAQIVNSTLSSGRYPAITVQQGIPVKWTINAPQGSINGCNNRMIIREYGIEHRFKPGDNLVEFTPERTGKFTYSCWMGMIRSSITVVAEGESLVTEKEPDLNPVPAGVVIPVDSIAVAKFEKAENFDYQTVTINLRDDGFEPSVLLMQKGLPALWIINNDSLDPGNSRLIVPSAYAQLDLTQGDNALQLMPFEDFDFSTADNVFYGYVKVTDDIGGADIDAIKAEVSNHETMIYPDAYFEQAAQGMSCCR